MKTTKTIALIIVAVCATFQMRSSNPTKDGVYRTCKDFESHHLTDSVYAVDKKHSLKDNWMDQVVLKEGKVKHKYTEGEIYAYLLNGKEYRYFDNDKPFAPKGYFQILDTTGLVIYSQDQPMKSDGSVTYYYYSNGLNSPIKALSRKNLKYELKNKEFVMELFKMKNLTERLNGCYTVNCVYKAFKDLPTDL